MEIDKKKCVGCGNCHAICTMGAIYLDEDGKSVVNQAECVSVQPAVVFCEMKSICPGLFELCERFYRPFG